MGRYRSKPVVVEAVQWFPNQSIFHAGIYNDLEGADKNRPYVVTIHNERAHIEPGDWIIAEPDGRSFYPCKPDIFSAKYEPADAATAIALNQVITPAQAPGKDEHTLERIDDAEAIEDLGPPALIAPYRRPADKRVKALLDEAARNRTAAAAIPPRTIYSDPRLAPDYKPPKKLPPR